MTYLHAKRQSTASHSFNSVLDSGHTLLNLCEGDDLVAMVTCADKKKKVK